MRPYVVRTPARILVQNGDVTERRRLHVHWNPARLGRRKLVREVVVDRFRQPEENVTVFVKVSLTATNDVAWAPFSVELHCIDSTVL